MNSCKSLENVTKTESVWMSASTDWSILQIHLGELNHQKQATEKGFLKNLKFTRKHLYLLKVSIQLYEDRSSRPEVFSKTGVLKNVAKFTGKHLCQSPPSASLGLQLYLKKDSGTGVFL